MRLIDVDEEVGFMRTARFAEGGLITQRLVLAPNAAAGRLPVSDAAGQATWTATSAITLALTDSLFTVLDNVDPARIFALQLDGLTAGTHTFRPPPTAAASTATLAAIDLAQTFTAAQTFAPTSGTAVTVTPPSGTATALLIAFTDTAWPTNGNVVQISPTITPTSTISSEARAVFINCTMNKVQDTGVRGLRLDMIATQDAGAAGNLTSVAGLLFRVTGSGTSGVDWAGIQGINGTVLTSGGDNYDLTQCAALFTTIGAGTTVDEARGLDIGQPTSTGTIVNDWNAINIRANTGGATNSGTAAAIRVGNYTRAATNWSLAIGTSSSAADSFHWGRLAIGSGTAPAHRLDIAAGTSTVAPIRLASFAAITTPVVGCLEFTTDDVFFTITTGAARKAFVLDDGARLTSGRVPFATTNGRLIDDADMTFATDTLTVTKLVAPTSIQVGGGAIVGNLDHGTYTPTLTGVTNVAASTAYQAQYLRVGNTVTVSGKCDVDPTAGAGTATELGISLPIASNFGAVEDCAGVGAGHTVAGESAAIFGDLGNDRASMIWRTNDAANHEIYFVFSYQVI